MNIEPVGTLRGLKEDGKDSSSISIAIEPNGAVGSDLARVQDHSHVLITAWVAKGEQGSLSTRVAKVTGRNNDGYLLIDGVDWPEGTSILSIDGYEPSELCVFSARDGKETVYPSDRQESELLADLIGEAARFHGEACAGVVLGAKVVLHMMQTWQVGQRDPRLRLWVGSDGCIADTIIALTGVTLGTARLKVPGGRIYRFVLEDKGLAYYPTEEAYGSAAEVLTKSVQELFAIREETERSEQRKPLHEKRPPKLSKEEEAIVQKVLNSLVEDKLSCAMAYRIADEMGVHILDVGRAADEAKVKISHCQLGCFR